jgi:5'-3' exonuclease
MGIPYFFKKLTDEYPDIIQTKDNLFNKKLINYLFLDFNCCIYGCVNDLVKNDIEYKNNKEFEKDLIIKVLEYIDIIFDYIIPKELFYISIDGIPPRSKMIQQRNRRYMKYWKLNKISNQTNIYEWDTNAISPGTEFMNKLSISIKNKIKSEDKFIKIKSILSDSIEEGEGEFKIFDYIDNNYSKLFSDNNGTDNKECIIYGLDADLIMLSILNAEKFNKLNFYLLREPLFLEVKNYNNEDVPFIFLNIKKYIKNIKFYYNDFFPNEKDNMIQNFVFLCFFLGNDFVPHLSYLNFKNKGLEHLLSSYKKISTLYSDIYPNILIIDNYINNDFNNNVIKKNKDDKIKISYMFIKYLLSDLAIDEENKLVEISESFYNKKPFIKRCKNEEEYNLQKLELYPLFNKPTDKIIIGGLNWEKRYYFYNFDLKIGTNEDNVNNICLNFLESIIFTFEYYFYKKYHKTWFYHYNNTPLIKDICNYLNNQLILHSIIYNNTNSNDIDTNNTNSNDIDINNTNSNDIINNFQIKIGYNKLYPNIKINTEMQLLMILPPQSSNILTPRCCELMKKKNSSIYHYFPINFNIEINYKYYLWMCTPILPFIDLQKIYNVYKNLN